MNDQISNSPDSPRLATEPSSHLGIVLFGHGSRDPNWRLPMEAVAAQIRSREPATPVVCAYLELCEPSLPDAAAALITQGAERVKIFPLFLGVGKHAREDLPLLVSEIRASHPETQVELMATAGENPALIALMADLALA